ncbi:MAG: ATP-binding cassette domain-containing protein [Ruminococcaceae bacterium]|nr:ATP-binding cassette domain-containing protein [Oscillospiraceae bacterium]
MIEVTGLSKRYGNFLAVDNVDFSISKGEVVGFLGPNGAGKSTIMNILTGYLSLTQGKVSIDGFDILRDPEEAKKRIGYLPELPPLYTDMKVREYLNFIYDLKKVRFPKKPHIEEIMRLVKIDHVQNRLIKHLSKGYRQRVGFAQALIGNPDVLILDEPTVGLDPKQIIEIRNLIAKLGKNHTIILSSHILSEISAICRRVIIINRGQIVADDTPDNLSAKLSKDPSLTARIVCDEEDMLAALSTVKGVARVSSLGRKEAGTYDFYITPKDGADIRAAVYERVVSRGKTILSLTANDLSLEQVFLRLTEVADNDEARRMLGTLPKKDDTNEEIDLEGVKINLEDLEIDEEGVDEE